MNKLATTLVSIGFTVATVPFAVAQTQNAPAVGNAEWHHSQRDHHEQRAFSMPGERAEARLAYLKTALQITPAQQAQWDAFANTIRAQAREQDRRIQERRAQRDQHAEEHQRPTAVERLQRKEQFYTVVLEDLKQRIAAGKPLYAVLTPEQQQIADKVLTSHHGRGKFDHHDMHHQA
jgi:hypothetical protein